MKRLFIFLFGLSTIIYSCDNDNDNDNNNEDSKNYDLEISKLEAAIDSLMNDLGTLKNIISLKDACDKQIAIVSATQQSVDKRWLILFADNTNVSLPEKIVKSLTKDTKTGEYTIVLVDDRIFVFNHTTIIRPTGITILTPEITYLKNMEIPIEFRVNPSNAVFNYDVTSRDCQIALDMANRMMTYSSYVTPPDEYRLVRVEQSVSADGKVKVGQYKAYIRDRGGIEAYRHATALVLSVVDEKGDTVRLSSSAIPFERKADTGLPVVVINTIDHIAIRDKQTWLPASMTIDGVGRFDNYNGAITIRGRGNWTWTYAKKPYSIKLNTKSKILGMPSHKRWVLLANYVDRTLLRNHIAFEVARRTGLEWTPHGQFVELVVNGEHRGNYYLCEQIRIDKNRVDIIEMEETDIKGDALTGGYLLEIDDYYDENNKFRSKIDSLPVMIQSPDEDDLQPQQFEYIRHYIDSLERILHNPDFAKTRNYLSMIDINSYIDWWFVYEIMGNIEPIYPHSCYFYKNRQDVLKAGPVWDFDICANESGSRFYNANIFWIVHLFKDPVFVQAVQKRWTLLKPAFEEVVPLIKETGDYIERSTWQNDQIWPRQPNFNGDDQLPFQNAVSQLHNYYVKRIDWLDQHIKVMQ